MSQKPKAKRLPKLTDAERHERFVETAHEVEASEDAKDFDKAFDMIARKGRQSRLGSTPRTPPSKSR